ncbi:nucleoporin NDC1 [Hyperolius riggenbachi]|uniref:nucleoporin NDC1 n=1 Tax=Hyperolius riggenbachi TaxID=752182 RepID=UPI0035A33853
MSDPTESRVLKWRVANTFAWSVILLPVTCVAFIVLSRLDFFHPVQWLIDSLGDISSSSTFFCLLLLAVLQAVQCAFNVKFFSVVPSIPGSRLALIGQVLLPQRVVHSLVHAFMGWLVFWCCTILSQGPYQSLAVPCKTEPSAGEPDITRACLNERYLFLLLTGALAGYSYSLLYFTHNMSYLAFPFVQQFKYVRFRRFLPLLLHHSCVQSLYLLRNSAAIYFFLGYIPRIWIQVTMNLHIDRQLPALDSLRGLLDLGLFYQIWLSGTFLFTTWHIVWLLFQIHTTETRMFPVQMSFIEDAELSLPSALSCSSPLLKYLAFQDLVLLAQYSPIRRQEVFSLSQPGGHPHNWSAICRECLSVLSNLTSRLVAHQEAAASNGRVRLPSSSAETKKSSSSSGSSLNETADQTLRAGVAPRTPIPSLMKTRGPWDSSSVFASPAIGHISGMTDQNSPWHGAVQSPHLIRRGAKLWTCGPDVNLQGSPPKDSSAPQMMLRPISSSEGPSVFLSFFHNKQEQIKNYLSKRMLIMYLFSKHPEASSQEVFADSQIHIWAVEGLSHLVWASYSEDQMGVVQTTLSSILTTLLTLQEAVEKHFKLPHASSKPTRAATSLADTSYKTLRFALRSTLKTAIYRITTKFGEHLHAVPVSSEHRKKLQQFLDFKE